MRKELKIIGSRDRHVFTATFIRFGFRDGYKGPVKTILLQDVLLDGKIVTDHLWFDLTKGFESADLLPGDVVEFCARVSIIEIADKDAERAMAFLKEAYPFNEETEVFIRKRYNMSIDVDPEEN